MPHVMDRGTTGKPRWYAKIGINGRQVWRSLRDAKTKRDAERLAYALEDRMRENPESIRKRDTKVNDFWNAYEPWARLHKGVGTVDLEHIYWRQMVAFLNPPTLTSIKKEDVERFKMNRCSEVGPQTVNNTLRHLQAVFNDAIDLKLCTGPNPFVGVVRFKLDKNPPRFLTVGQIATVSEVAHAHSPEADIVFALGIHLGLRKREISFARWEWFDFDRMVVTLVSEPDLGFFLKSHEARTIPLKRDLAEILQPYRKASGHLLVNPDAPAVRAKTPKYRFNFEDRFESVVEQAGVGDWVTPHILRHTFASQAVISGVSLFKVQKWLGHADPKTTMIYAHLQAQDEDINKF